jgi:hypothetical protein
MIHHNSQLFFTSMLFTIVFINILLKVLSFIVNSYEFVVIMICEPEKLINNKLCEKDTMKSKYWCIISMLIVGYLGINSLVKNCLYGLYGLYGLNSLNSFTIYQSIASCSQIENYDLSQSMYPLGILTGYFVHDIIFNSPSPQFIFHHLLSICSSFVIIYSEYSIGAYYHEILLITEISTIFLNMYHLCVNTEKRKIVCMILFTLSFTIVRPFYIFMVLLKIFECFRYETLYVTMCVLVFSLYVLNMYWYYAIIRKIYNLFQKNPDQVKTLQNNPNKTE